MGLSGALCLAGVPGGAGPQPLDVVTESAPEALKRLHAFGGKVHPCWLQPVGLVCPFRPLGGLSEIQASWTRRAFAFVQEEDFYPFSP